MKENDGVTLIELLIVVSIIGILVIALGFSFQGWMGNYRIESQTKDLYSDLQDARTRAMTMNRMHFATGTANAYTIYNDTNPAPDGNGTLEIASDTRLPTYPKSVEYPINWTGIGAQIRFDRRGMMLDSGRIYCNPNEPLCCASNTCSALDQNSCKNPDYDCIVIAPTRINMGKWDGANCVEK